MTGLKIVIVESDPFVGEDISAALGSRFPLSVRDVFASFDEARPALHPGADPLLAVISVGTTTPLAVAPEDFLALQAAALVLIDADGIETAAGNRCRRLSKPFTQDMLIEAACAALGPGTAPPVA